MDYSENHFQDQDFYAKPGRWIKIGPGIVKHALLIYLKIVEILEWGIRLRQFESVRVRGKEMKDGQNIEMEISELDRSIEQLEESLRNDLSELHGLYRLREFKELLLCKVEECVAENSKGEAQAG